ncbi:hypothetical protein GGI25_001223 [Coemansia spiralis]|uniref:Uncharacterized protein n=2 Tax=Coemansia TaxID=4863 RepID=A0A9W8GAU2_9FUNG|nr:hypothetical protein EDC05_001296 [Coemansia umbellata]KAJ2624641.1 hypothetical protein GGI26_001335 [Coemansia sp. RSA 1358]KAJ2679772.1 hypothetical protein GGI25_001223 [Coemansia spiralis]
MYRLDLNFDDAYGYANDRTDPADAESDYESDADSTDQSGSSPWNRLGCRLLQRIVSFLPRQSDRRSFCMVNKDWALAGEPSLWAYPEFSTPQQLSSFLHVVSENPGSHGRYIRGIRFTLTSHYDRHLTSPFYNNCDQYTDAELPTLLEIAQGRHVLSADPALMRPLLHGSDLTSPLLAFRFARLCSPIDSLSVYGFRLREKHIVSDMMRWNLRDLEIIGMPRKPLANLGFLLHGLRSLRSLRIESDLPLPADAWNPLALRMSALHKLRIWAPNIAGSQLLRASGQVPRGMVVLHLVGSGNDASDDFVQQIATNSPGLQSLVVYSTNITARSAAVALGACKSLTHLELVRDTVEEAVHESTAEPLSVVSSCLSALTLRNLDVQDALISSAASVVTKLRTLHIAGSGYLTGAAVADLLRSSVCLAALGLYSCPRVSEKALQGLAESQSAAAVRVLIVNQCAMQSDGVERVLASFPGTKQFSVQGIEVVHQQFQYAYTAESDSNAPCSPTDAETDDAPASPKPLPVKRSFNPMYPDSHFFSRQKQLGAATNDFIECEGTRDVRSASASDPFAPQRSWNDYAPRHFVPGLLAFAGAKNGTDGLASAGRRRAATLYSDDQIESNAQQTSSGRMRSISELPSATEIMAPRIDTESAPLSPAEPAHPRDVETLATDESAYAPASRSLSTEEDSGNISTPAIVAGSAAVVAASSIAAAAFILDATSSGSDKPSADEPSTDEPQGVSSDQAPVDELAFPQADNTITDSISAAMSSEISAVSVTTNPGIDLISDATLPDTAEDASGSFEEPSIVVDEAESEADAPVERAIAVDARPSTEGTAVGTSAVIEEPVSSFPAAKEVAATVEESTVSEEPTARDVVVEEFTEAPDVDLAAKGESVADSASAQLAVKEPAEEPVADVSVAADPVDAKENEPASTPASEEYGDIPVTEKDIVSNATVEETSEAPTEEQAALESAEEPEIVPVTGEEAALGTTAKEVFDCVPAAKEQATDVSAAEEPITTAIDKADAPEPASEEQLATAAIQPDEEAITAEPAVEVPQNSVPVCVIEEAVVSPDVADDQDRSIDTVEAVDTAAFVSNADEHVAINGDAASTAALEDLPVIEAAEESAADVPAVDDLKTFVPAMEESAVYIPISEEQITNALAPVADETSKEQAEELPITASMEQPVSEESAPVVSIVQVPAVEDLAVPLGATEQQDTSADALNGAYTVASVPEEPAIYASAANEPVAAEENAGYVGATKEPSVLAPVDTDSAFDAAVTEPATEANAIERDVAAEAPTEPATTESAAEATEEPISNVGEQDVAQEEQETANKAAIEDCVTSKPVANELVSAAEPVFVDEPAVDDASVVVIGEDAAVPTPAVDEEQAEAAAAPIVEESIAGEPINEEVPAGSSAEKHAALNSVEEPVAEAASVVEPTQETAPTELADNESVEKPAVEEALVIAEADSPVSEEQIAERAVKESAVEDASDAASQEQAAVESIEEPIAKTTPTVTENAATESLVVGEPTTDNAVEEPVAEATSTESTQEPVSTEPAAEENASMLAPDSEEQAMTEPAVKESVEETVAEEAPAIVDADADAPAPATEAQAANESAEEPTVAEEAPIAEECIEELASIEPAVEDTLASGLENQDAVEHAKDEHAVEESAEKPAVEDSPVSVSEEHVAAEADDKNVVPEAAIDVPATINEDVPAKSIEEALVDVPSADELPTSQISEEAVNVVDEEPIAEASTDNTPPTEDTPALASNDLIVVDPVGESVVPEATAEIPTTINNVPVATIEELAGNAPCAGEPESSQVSKEAITATTEEPVARELASGEPTVKASVGNAPPAEEAIEPTSGNSALATDAVISADITEEPPIFIPATEDNITEAADPAEGLLTSTAEEQEAESTTERPTNAFVTDEKNVAADQSVDTAAELLAFTEAAVEEHEVPTSVVNESAVEEPTVSTFDPVCEQAEESALPADIEALPVSDITKPLSVEPTINDLAASTSVPPADDVAVAVAEPTAKEPSIGDSIIPGVVPREATIDPIPVVIPSELEIKDKPDLANIPDIAEDDVAGCVPVAVDAFIKDPTADAILATDPQISEQVAIEETATDGKDPLATTELPALGAVADEAALKEQNTEKPVTVERSIDVPLAAEDPVAEEAVDASIVDEHTAEESTNVESSIPAEKALAEAALVEPTASELESTSEVTHTLGPEEHAAKEAVIEETSPVEAIVIPSAAEPVVFDESVALSELVDVDSSAEQRKAAGPAVEEPRSIEEADCRVEVENGNTAAAEPAVDAPTEPGTEMLKSDVSAPAEPAAVTTTEAPVAESIAEKFIPEASAFAASAILKDAVAEPVDQKAGGIAERSIGAESVPSDVAPADDAAVEEQLAAVAADESTPVEFHQEEPKAAFALVAVDAPAIEPIATETVTAGPTAIVGAIDEHPSLDDTATKEQTVVETPVVDRAVDDIASVAEPIAIESVAAEEPVVDEFAENVAADIPAAIDSAHVVKDTTEQLSEKPADITADIGADNDRERAIENSTSADIPDIAAGVALTATPTDPALANHTDSSMEPTLHEMRQPKTVDADQLQSDDDEGVVDVDTKGVREYDNDALLATDILDQASKSQRFTSDKDVLESEPEVVDYEGSSISSSPYELVEHADDKDITKSASMNNPEISPAKSETGSVSPFVPVDAKESASSPVVVGTIEEIQSPIQQPVLSESADTDRETDVASLALEQEAATDAPRSVAADNSDPAPLSLDVQAQQLGYTPQAAVEPEVTTWNSPNSQISYNRTDSQASISRSAFEAAPAENSMTPSMSKRDSAIYMDRSMKEAIAADPQSAYYQTVPESMPVQGSDAGADQEAPQSVYSSFSTPAFPQYFSHPDMLQQSQQEIGTGIARREVPRASNVGQMQTKPSRSKDIIMELNIETPTDGRQLLQLRVTDDLDELCEEFCGRFNMMDLLPGMKSLVRGKVERRLARRRERALQAAAAAAREQTAV